MKLRIRQAIYIVLAVAAFALLIFVVTNSQSPESLMNPPEAAGDYKNIQSVIEKSIGAGIILKAPNEGDYTTSITFLDLNKDNENDALAFYRIKNDDTSSIYMSVLLKNDSKWKPSEPIKGKGNDVLEFAYGDLNYDAVPEIVVGWNMFDSKDNNTLCVYSVKDSSQQTQVKECDSKIYTKMLVADVCAESRSEIMLIKNTYLDESAPATASVYEFVDNQLKVIDTCQLQSAVSEYKQFQMQSVENTNVFFLDGVVDTQNMITEIVYWNAQKKALENPVYEKDATQIVTYREATVPATDINDDDLLEIPFQSEESEAGFAHTTIWKQFGFEKFEDIARGICTDELIFRFPEKWENRVAVAQKGKVWSFYDAEAEEKEKLFDLVITDISDWQSVSSKYEKVKIYYGTVYGVSFSDSDSAYMLSKDEIGKSIINIH
ncbi:MAG: hypothetical protein IJJ41_00725 [Clostridia bacterium]|nr:hypothetical protein [Clostridia bacterium]